MPSEGIGRDDNFVSPTSGVVEEEEEVVVVEEAVG